MAVWTHERAKGQDADLDLVTQVQDAGFLSEFVLLVYGKPGWTVPAETLRRLDTEKFIPWAREHLQGHHLGPVATTTPGNGKTWPDPPGADLPDPRALAAQGPSPCLADVELDRAVERWEPLEANLDGSPVAAANPQDFLWKLAALKANPPARGVTWVAPRVGELFFLAGFCANDRQSWPRAQALLERAVAMAPTDVNARLELAQAYSMEKEPDRGVQQVQAVLRLTQNPCELARAWRKLGFIRYDQARWAEAKQAYDTSLLYEPGNALALSELKLIARALAKEPGGPVRDVGPPSFQLTTHCTAPEGN